MFRKLRLVHCASDQLNSYYRQITPHASCKFHISHRVMENTNSEADGHNKSARISPNTKAKLKTYVIPVAGGVVAIALAPVALSAVGFTGGGVAAGSIAAGMQSVTSSIGIGSCVVGTLQSAGAAGLGIAGNTLAWTGGAAVTHKMQKGVGKLAGKWTKTDQTQTPPKSKL